jgi:hypothetical protein
MRYLVTMAPKMETKEAEVYPECSIQGGRGADLLPLPGMFLEVFESII